LKNVDDIRNGLIDFNKKYSMLDITFFLSAVYKHGEKLDQEFSTSFSGVEHLTEKYLSGFKDKLKYGYNTMIFSHFEIATRFGEKYERYKLLI